ncbi:Uncharacterised protein [Mycobacterium tuberculosis]|uniref:Uncharacterized protein n=1 Tax=Mycobacterium tuberculosis TaxID=1773 RepID=A0A654U6G7_MYCTX|nr:Uncharacterised protein [Mycobacterium tuberculosis]CKT65241.1 Uncharacterised protein [Mycobacterium tuberculosis]CKU12326.1 Uncharacterised protein [Mycobacterium tuberculosis]CMF97375.1 Uncharacterised protein [Mycobacterium tuberculosis]CNV62077.1 Uncharacterised protein [Mycobacterium tuberculosis]
MAVTAASTVSMFDTSQMCFPASIGGLACSDGNFSAPFAVSAWRSTLMVDKFAANALLD